MVKLPKKISRKRGRTNHSKEIEKLWKEIVKKEKETKRKNYSFQALTKDALAKKVRGKTANSPFFYWHGFTVTKTRGAEGRVNIGVSNPSSDPYRYHMQATMFFGASNWMQDLGVAIAGRDTNFPYVGATTFPLASGETKQIDFTYPTPLTILPGTYYGNVILWEGDFRGRGRVYDRLFFYFHLR